MYPKTIVMQPLPGIGDMIWHTPHLHAIARHSAQQKITVLTKARSLAGEIFKIDSSIENIIHIARHPGSHDKWWNFYKFSQQIKHMHFDRAIILHNSFRYALLAKMAGIKEIWGYKPVKGFSFINRGQILESEELSLHPRQKADIFCKQNGFDLIPEDDKIYVDVTAIPDLQKRLARYQSPLIVLGIGCSEVARMWPLERFASLIQQISAVYPQATFLACGGPQDSDFAQELAIVAPEKSFVLPMVDLSLSQMIALISMADLYVGNDTSLMNIAASLGKPTFGLFFANDPFNFWPNLIPLKTQSLEGMKVEYVLTKILPYLEKLTPKLPAASI